MRVFQGGETQHCDHKGTQPGALRRSVHCFLHRPSIQTGARGSVRRLNDSRRPSFASIYCCSPDGVWIFQKYFARLNGNVKKTRHRKVCCQFIRYAHAFHIMPLLLYATRALPRSRVGSRSQISRTLARYILFCTTHWEGVCVLGGC